MTTTLALVGSSSDTVSHRSVQTRGRPFPATREQAQAALPAFSRQAFETYRQFISARRAWEQASGELEVVRAVARGEFDEPLAPTHAVGSRGSWPLGRIQLPDADGWMH